MQVMILGDLHGNARAAVHSVYTAKDAGIGTILQVGDFGLWDHELNGVKFLDELNSALVASNAMLVWVDGNHENFDRLDWYVGNNPRNRFGQVYIRSNILYSPRGCLFKLGARRFMSVGGAVSIDKSWRKLGKSWWKQEQLTDGQLEDILAKHAASPGKIDVLLTHDCPTTAPFGTRIKNDPDSLVHRQRMDRLAKAVKPELWFHGHMHTKFDGYDFPAYEPTTTVYGLECDGMLENWGVLNLDAMNFQFHKDFKYSELLSMNL